MPSCSQPSRTLRAAEAVARRRAILDRRCARRHIARAGRDGRMVPIEQKDWTKEDRAAIGQNHPLDSTKRQRIRCDAGPSAGAQCSGPTRAAIHHGAEKPACKKTPPVKRATLKTSDSASIPTSLSEAGVLVMSPGGPIIDPRSPVDVQIAASADRFVHATGAPLRERRLK
jgi:hypothetical protein